MRLIRTMWSEPRASFSGKYFHTDAAILEPKPLQRPQPPIMIAGGGEQMTLRAVARLGDACNVGGDPDMVRHKYAVLRQHCEAAGRPYEAIERTAITSFLLANTATELAAKRARLDPAGTFGGYAVTVAQAAEIVGRYAEAGVQLLISSIYKNDPETQELLASEILPAYA